MRFDSSNRLRVTLLDVRRACRERPIASVFRISDIRTGFPHTCGWGCGYQGGLDSSVRFPVVFRAALMRLARVQTLPAKRLAKFDFGFLRHLMPRGSVVQSNVRLDLRAPQPRACLRTV